MKIRLVQVVASLAAPLTFAALSLGAPDARAESAPRRGTPPTSHGPRRFAPPPTAPAAYSRPRVPAQLAAPPATRTTPTQPPAASSASPVMVGIEIREIRAGAPAQLERFSLPLGDGGQSRIEVRAGDSEYRLSLHRDGPGPNAPLVFDVRKSQRTAKGPSSEARVNATVRVRAGQPVVIAAIDRPDGSRTEVLAQIQ